MSIIASQLHLLANQQQIEQNQTVILSARVFDQYGNPIPNQDVSLIVDHVDYSGPVVLTHGATDVNGTALFEIALRNAGNTTLSAKSGSLDSGPLKIQVLPSTIPPSGPRTWPGVARSLTRLEVDLNTLIGQMIAKGLEPTKQDLCDNLGLDYDRAKDRNKISQALYDLKMWFDYLWRVLYQQSPSYGRDFSTLMNDSGGYSKWKSDQNSPSGYLKAYYHLTEDEIHELWVLSQMWDRFVQTANQYNLHLFVAYDSGNNVWCYKQPGFWEYVDKQIRSASRLGKGIRTILSRHRDLGMILTSGEPIHKALETAQDVHKMITDRSAPRFRCPVCWKSGLVVELSSQDEYVGHIKSAH